MTLSLANPSKCRIFEASRLAEPEMEPTPDVVTGTPDDGIRLAEPEMEPTPDTFSGGSTFGERLAEPEMEPTPDPCSACVASSR